MFVKQDLPNGHVKLMGNDRDELKELITEMTGQAEDHNVQLVVLEDNFESDNGEYYYAIIAVTVTTEMNSAKAQV